MHRMNPRQSADRVGMGISRAVIDKINDSPFLQTMGLKIVGGEQSSDVEHAHPFGFTAYPKAKTSDEDAAKGMMKGAAEVFLMSLMGNRSHPVGMPAIDRRFRPNGMREGEVAFHDAHKQYLHFTQNSAVLESPTRFVFRVAAQPSDGAKAKNGGASLAVEKADRVTMSAKADGTLATTSKDATTVTGKTVGVTAGTKPDTAGNHELNQQLKGLRADMSQIKDSHHALFDVVSKLRANVESVVPALVPVNLASQVTKALNGAPGGLDVMKSLAEGKLQEYFQNALKDALKEYLDPSRMLNAASVLSGGIEGLIANVEAQIAGLLAAHPIARQVDGLLSRIEALADAPLPSDVVQAARAMLQAQVEYLAANHPVVGQIAQLRRALQGLIDAAGPGLGFLAPQQRLARGLTRSMLFSKGG